MWLLGKPDVIFRDSPLTGLDMSGKTGNESSHILLFQNHETVVWFFQPINFFHDKLLLLYFLRVRNTFTLFCNMDKERFTQFSTNWREIVSICKSNEIYFKWIFRNACMCDLYHHYCEYTACHRSELIVDVCCCVA